MTRSVPLELPSGRTVYAEVEAGDGEWRQLAAGEKGKGRFQDSIDTLREMLATMAQGLDNVGPRRPDTVTLELSVELASGGVIKLLGGQCQGRDQGVDDLEGDVRRRRSQVSASSLAL